MDSASLVQFASALRKHGDSISGDLSGLVLRVVEDAVSAKEPSD